MVTVASLLFTSLDDYDVAAVNGVIETHAGRKSIRDALSFGQNIVVLL